MSLMYPALSSFANYNNCAETLVFNYSLTPCFCQPYPKSCISFLVHFFFTVLHFHFIPITMLLHLCVLKDFVKHVRGTN